MNHRRAIFRGTTVVAVASSAVALAVVGGTADARTPSPNTVRSTTPSGPVAEVASGDRFAVINSDGTFARGKGVNSSTNLTTGQYEVIFNRNVSRCAFIATVGSSASSGTEPTGEITTVRRVGTANGVFLSTHDSSGAFANRGFHLMVACP